MRLPRVLTDVLASLTLVSLAFLAAPAGATGFDIDIGDLGGGVVVHAEFDSAALARLGILSAITSSNHPTASCSETYRSFTTRNTMLPSVRRRARDYCRALELDAVVSRAP